jgi:hypothetical protein
MTKDLF